MNMPGCLSHADLDRLLAEDIPYGDLTTLSLAQLSSWQRCGTMSMTARYDMRLCGTEEVQQLLNHMNVAVEASLASGVSVTAGTPLLQARGHSQTLLAAWKLTQTLLEWASGVASAVAHMVAAATAINPNAVVACTRKTVPFTRVLAAKAVRAGGGSMHRLNLSDSVLLFPEHLQFLSGSLCSLDAIAALRRAAPERSLVAEVLDVEQAREWAAHVQVLQLEKFPVQAVAQVAAYIKERGLSTVLAAAGGVNPSNAGDYVAAGAQVLVTSWPYQAKPCDVQVNFAADDADA